MFTDEEVDYLLEKYMSYISDNTETVEPIIIDDCHREVMVNCNGTQKEWLELLEEQYLDMYSKLNKTILDGEGDNLSSYHVVRLRRLRSGNYKLFTNFYTCNGDITAIWCILLKPNGEIIKMGPTDRIK